MAEKTALVTGGAGFIGSYLAEALLEQSWEVYALDDLWRGSEANVCDLLQNPHFHPTAKAVLSPSVLSPL